MNMFTEEEGFTRVSNSAIFLAEHSWLVGISNGEKFFLAITDEEERVFYEPSECDEMMAMNCGH